MFSHLQRARMNRWLHGALAGGIGALVGFAILAGIYLARHDWPDECEAVWLFGERIGKHCTWRNSDGRVYRETSDIKREYWHAYAESIGMRPPPADSGTQKYLDASACLGSKPVPGCGQGGSP